MATQTPLTLEQFLALPQREADGTHYELSEGELITLSPSGWAHGVYVMNIGRILSAALDRKQYIVSGGEVGLILKSDSSHATVRGADVAVHERQKVASARATTFQSVPPVVAVEVVSTGNSAPDLELKVKQYLAAGTAEVWLLYPETRRLHLFKQNSPVVQIIEERETFLSTLGSEFAIAPFFEI